MIKLKKEMNTFLEECVKKHDASLMFVFEDNTSDIIDDELINQLRDIVTDEFILNGLNDNSEPNEYGLKLEQLIDDLGHIILK